MKLSMFVLLFFVIFISCGGNEEKWTNENSDTSGYQANTAGSEDSSGEFLDLDHLNLSSNLNDDMDLLGLGEEDTVMMETKGISGFVFTNCSQTGRTGPSQAQCNTAYSATNLNGQVTVTGGIQEWTVPATGKYKIETYGAEGGRFTAGRGGKGAYMKGDFDLTAGEVIRILVGQAGGAGPSGGSGNGGGGGTFVVKSGSPLIVAGGGGAQAGCGDSEGTAVGLDGTTSTSGLAGVGGGGAGGTGGGGGGAVTSSYPGAGGGGFSGDGTYGVRSYSGGCETGASGYSGLDGDANRTAGGMSFNSGGVGGRACYETSAIGGFGGGGGEGGCGGGGAGGYSGGGGGYSDYNGGGGGGSYNAGTNQVNTAGARTGHGLVVITRLCDGITPDPTDVTATPDAVCGAGTTVKLNATAPGATISWYTQATGGSAIGTSASGADFEVTPSGATTYYAEAKLPDVTLPSEATFNYTGAVQTWTVPAGITSIEIEAWGAQGGGGSSGFGTGGNGGYAKGTVSVTSGQVIYIYVGQQGFQSYNQIAFNGGGSGSIVSWDAAAGDGYTGGGASHVAKRTGTLQNLSSYISDIIVVAAGGGGAGGASGSWNSPANGGNGGGTTGTDGATVDVVRTGGGGGSQAAGGSSVDANSASGFGIGASGSLSTDDAIQGGGGGGGYYGGGAGSHSGGGGGGGSSYIGGVTGGTTTAGLRIGNGQVKITYASSTTTYCSSSRIAVSVGTASISNPTANDVTVTYDGSSHSASATPPADSSIVWYTAETGGSITTAPAGTTVGTYTVWAQANHNTYSCTSSGRTLVTLTINKATPTVSEWPSASNITYGQTLANSTLSSGSATVAGTFTFDAPATGPNAGTASYSMTFTPTDTVNYNTVTGSVSVTTNKASLTVTADNKSKVYGASEPALTFTPSGTLYYDDTYSVISGVSLATATGASATVGTHTITASGGTASNYEITYVNGTLSVTKAAALTVTADNKSKVYGASEPALTFTPSGTLYYGDTYSVISGVSLNTSTGASATFGNHTITASGGTADNYNVTHVNGTLTVSKADLNLINAVAADKIYDGDADTTISGDLNEVFYGGDVTLDSVAGTFADKNAGENRAVTSAMSIKGADAFNYNFIQPAGLKADITKRDLTLSEFAAESRIYNGTTVTTGDFSDDRVFGDDVEFSYTTNFDTKNWGNGKTVTFGAIAISGGIDADNYTLVTATGTATADIMRKDLTITLLDKSKIYSLIDPVFGINYSGFVPGEGPANICDEVFIYRETGETVGTYPIKVILIGRFDNDGNPSTFLNYNIPVNDGDGAVTGVEATFTITRKNLTVTNAVAVSKTYDGSVDTTISGAKLAGVSGSDDVAIDSVYGAFDTKDAGSSKAVTAALTLKGTAKDNYTLIQPAGLKADISRKELTVTAADKEKAYDGAVYSPFTVTYDGFIAGEDQGDLGGALVFGGDAVAAVNTGTYADQIIPSGLAAVNYSFIYVPGTLTITSRAVVVTADVKSKVYGNEDPELTYTAVPALIGSDAFSGSLARVEGENTGTYEIQQGTLAIDGNYTMEFVPANLTITPATLSVVADAGITKVYGSEDPEFTYTVTGYKNGDDAGVLSGALSRVTGENANLYDITTGTLTAGDNYVIDLTSTKFAITKAALTITADSKGKVYGTTDPAFTVTYSGFQFSDNAGSLSGSYNIFRQVGENVGLYDIKLFANTLNSNNYNITAVNGVFEITAASTTVEWIDPADIVYGTALSPAELNAAVNVEGTFVYTPAEGTILNAGFMQMLHVEFIPDDSLNYTGSSKEVFINVTPAELTATADNKERNYGEANPALTISYLGFVSTDTTDDIDALPEASTTADTESPAGDYGITVSGGSDSNYTFNYVNGTLTVKAVVPAVTTDSITGVTVDSASVSGTVTSNGGTDILARGICISENENPATTDACMNDASGNSTFTVQFTGLTEGTTYHVRAYAMNSADTAYGADLTFKAVKHYALSYSAGADGSLTGNTSQEVEEGADGSAVTAVADEGYHFTEWSDGVTDNPRTDLNVMSDITVTATFEEDPKGFCKNPEEIAELPYTHSTTTAGRESDLTEYGAGCGVMETAEYTSPDYIYSLELTAGDRVEITLTPSEGFDGILAITGTCSENEACDSYANDGAAGAAESIIYEAAEDRTIFIVVEGNEGSTGAYTLEVKEWIAETDDDVTADDDTITVDEDGITVDEDGITVDEDGITVDEDGITVDEDGI
ncbi:MAG TPA: MBG domain-containing protein, partial [bacterium]|nr:MBG domain-containing protein [bacterium]